MGAFVNSKNQMTRKKFEKIRSKQWTQLITLDLSLGPAIIIIHFMKVKSDQQSTTSRFYRLLQQ